MKNTLNEYFASLRKLAEEQIEKEEKNNISPFCVWEFHADQFAGGIYYVTACNYGVREIPDSEICPHCNRPIKEKE